MKFIAGSLRQRSVGLLLAALAVTSMSAKAAQPESPSQSGDRMAWFKEAKFGMFIHWGIYSVPAGEWNGKTSYAEWFQLQTKMPNAQYEKFASQFDPVKFDPKAWAKCAHDAGMKYVVITAKHHDGFCMFGTKLTKYNVVDATPFHKDPMKPLADAVRAEGMKFCFYYSVPDWHDRDFPAKYSQRGFHGDPDPNADLDKYVEYVKGQIRELLTNYGPIGIIWFDGGGAFGKDEAGKARLMHAQEIIDEIHQLQPDCLVNNRLGLPGDYGTPEQKIPGGKSTKPFEVCMTLNKHWGYNKHDNNWKDEKTVVRNVADIASKGGNYLLNVGPTAEGVFPQPAVDILEKVGQWMKVNGESIYGTSASPLDKAPEWGRITQKGKILYLHVFDWPADGKLAVKGVKGDKAYLLANQGRAGVKAEAEGDGVTITLPGAAPDAVDSVVVLEGE